MCRTSSGAGSSQPQRQHLTCKMPGTASLLDVSFSPITLLLCIACLLITLLIHTKRNAKALKEGRRWAPSPPGYPVVGNLPDIIKAAKADRMHLQMQTWAKEYGPVVKVSAGTIDVSICGDSWRREVCLTMLICLTFFSNISSMRIKPLKRFWINTVRLLPTDRDGSTPTSMLKANTSHQNPVLTLTRVARRYVCDQKNVLLLSASHPRWKVSSFLLVPWHTWPKRTELVNNRTSEK